MDALRKIEYRYNKTIEKTVSENLKILLESFVEFYGEEYRDVIERRLNEIEYIFYVDFKTVDEVVEQEIIKDRDPETHKDFLELYEANKKRSFISRATSKFKRIPYNLVCVSNANLLSTRSSIRFIKSLVRGDEGESANLVGSDGTIKRCIIFPILHFNEHSFIHEINHAVTRDTLMIVEDTSEDPLVEKVGLAMGVGTEGDRILEELINDRSAKDITEIFKRRGGDLSTFCRDLPFINSYTTNMFMIEEFYSTFLDEIKNAKVSTNLNAIFHKLGRVNIERFKSLLVELYDHENIRSEEEQEKVLSQIRPIVDDMKRNLIEDKHNPEDIKGKIDLLREMGYKITETSEHKSKSM